MAASEGSMLWTTDTSGDGTTKYTEVNWTTFISILFSRDTASEGVLWGRGNNLNATIGGGLFTLQSGYAIDAGFFYWNTASFNISIPATTANTRRDLIVLRVDYNANTVRAERLVGVEGAAAPIPTRNSSIWEIPLWEVVVPLSGSSSLVDRRAFARFATVVDSNMLWGALTMASPLTVLRQNTTVEGGKIVLQSSETANAQNRDWYIDVFKFGSWGRLRIRNPNGDGGITIAQGKIINNSDGGLYPYLTNIQGSSANSLVEYPGVTNYAIANANYANTYERGFRGLDSVVNVGTTYSLQVTYAVPRGMIPHVQLTPVGLWCDDWYVNNATSTGFQIIFTPKQTYLASTNTANVRGFYWRAEFLGADLT